jgi:hypothetical protein
MLREIIIIARTIFPFPLLKNRRNMIRINIGIVQLCSSVIIGIIKSKSEFETV